MYLYKFFQPHRIIIVNNLKVRDILSNSENIILKIFLHNVCKKTYFHLTFKSLTFLK